MVQYLLKRIAFRHLIADLNDPFDLNWGDHGIPVSLYGYWFYAERHDGVGITCEALTRQHSLRSTFHLPVPPMSGQNHFWHEMFFAKETHLRTSCNPLPPF